MRDRLFTLTKLPRTLSETGKVTLEQLDEVAEKKPSTMVQSFTTRKKPA